MYRVKRYFADATTGKRYAAGDLYEGTPDGVAGFQAAGLIARTAYRAPAEAAEPAKGAKAPEPAKAAKPAKAPAKK